MKNNRRKSEEAIPDFLNDDYSLPTPAEFIINRISNIQFIKEYLNYFHVSKIDMKIVFHIFRKRIECWRRGHNYSNCIQIGNSYVSVCKNCGKKNTFTLMKDSMLFHD